MKPITAITPMTVLFLMLIAPPSGAATMMDLWPGQPPHSKPSTLEEHVKEAWGVPCAYDVTRPTLTIYPAQGENCGRAIVIFPGGGYALESIVAEGRLIAEALASRGITAAVLKYRLPLLEASDEPQLLPLTDARRALSLMRSLAKQYGFDPAKVGVLGFSAGGHLAATVSVLRSEDKGENPDFSALIYGVTTLSPANQKWLEEALFHRAMTAAEKQQYSLVDHVDARTPPAFLVHAFDDDVVPIRESQLYAQALAAAGQGVEVHFFAKGGHGFGPGRAQDGTGQWMALLAEWIHRR